jgi:hypothetical protein
MRLSLTNKLISAALFAVMVLFGALAIPVQAQRIVVERHPRVFIHTGFFPRPWWGPNYYVVDPVAYEQDQGYRDGLSRGKSDAEHGRPDDPNNHKHFRNADSLTYRNAFAQGYQVGYEQRG